MAELGVDKNKIAGSEDGQHYVPLDSIRSLLHYVVNGLDDRLEEYRRGTRYEGIRPSDVRLFVLALRKPRTTAELARILRISRQAVHMSVQRLRQLKVIDLAPSPGNSREKLVVITDRGEHARHTAEEQNKRLEAECAEVLGVEGLEQLRLHLAKLRIALDDTKSNRGVALPL